MGRKKKYETVKAFERAVDAYFNSISRQVPMKIPELTGFSNEAKPMYKAVPFKNEAGEQVMTYEYAKPPSVTGLCIFLGMTREALRGYRNREAFADAVESATLRIEDYLAEELMSRRHVEGVKFNLQHNYGWKERSEVEAVVPAAAPMSASEKLALIDELIKNEQNR
ncbi:MAG: DNA-packaging protein [Oscillospiraceae bacterium]|nr:DNA-packaging protein [Oscillospiraceae bacterium]